jgi:hypothetical protein
LKISGQKEGYGTLNNQVVERVNKNNSSNGGGDGSNNIGRNSEKNERKP